MDITYDAGARHSLSQARIYLELEIIIKRVDYGFPKLCEGLGSNQVLSIFFVILQSCSQEAWQYHQFDLSEREWFLTLMSTMNCGACKLMLYEPVVINCGHVFCSACIDPEVIFRNIPFLCY